MVMSSSPHPNSRDRAETPSRLMASACITPLTSSQTSAVSEVSHVARHERIIRACGHVAMRLCKAARTHTLTRAHDPRRTPRRAPSSPTFLPLPEHALPLPRGCPLLIQLARSSYTSHAPPRCPSGLHLHHRLSPPLPHLSREMPSSSRDRNPPPLLNTPEAKENLLRGHEAHLRGQRESLPGPSVLSFEANTLLGQYAPWPRPPCS